MAVPTLAESRTLGRKARMSATPGLDALSLLEVLRAGRRPKPLHVPKGYAKGGQFTGPRSAFGAFIRDLIKGGRGSEGQGRLDSPESQRRIAQHLAGLSDSQLEGIAADRDITLPKGAARTVVTSAIVRDVGDRGMLVPPRSAKDENDLHARERRRSADMGGHAPERVKELHDEAHQHFAIAHRGESKPAKKAVAAKKAALAKTASSRMSEEDRQALTKQYVRAYVYGASLSDIATASGKSQSFVHERLVTSGVQLRGRGASRPRSAEDAARRSRETERELAQLRKMTGTPVPEPGAAKSAPAKATPSDAAKPDVVLTDADRERFRAWAEALPDDWAQKYGGLGAPRMVRDSDRKPPRVHGRAVLAALEADDPRAFREAASGMTRELARRLVDHENFDLDTYDRLQRQWTAWVEEVDGRFRERHLAASAAKAVPTKATKPATPRAATAAPARKPSDIVGAERKTLGDDVAKRFTWGHESVESIAADLAYNGDLSEAGARKLVRDILRERGVDVRPAKAVGAARTVPTVAELSGDWTNPPSREETAAKLEGFTKAELLPLARELSIPGATSKSVPDLRHEIVEATVGRRLDSIAIRGFTEERPGEAPLPADMPPTQIAARYNLSLDEAKAYKAWLANHPGASVAQWQTRRRERASKVTARQADALALLEYRGAKGADVGDLARTPTQRQTAESLVASGFATRDGDHLTITDTGREAMRTHRANDFDADPIAQRIIELRSEEAIIRDLSSNQYTAAQLRRIAAAVNLSPPPDMRAKSSLLLYIAENVWRDRTRWSLQ